MPSNDAKEAYQNFICVRKIEALSETQPTAAAYGHHDRRWCDDVRPRCKAECKSGERDDSQETKTSDRDEQVRTSLSLARNLINSSLFVWTLR